LHRLNREDESRELGPASDPATFAIDDEDFIRNISPIQYSKSPICITSSILKRIYASVKQHTPSLHPSMCIKLSGPCHLRSWEECRHIPLLFLLLPGSNHSLPLNGSSAILALVGYINMLQRARYCSQRQTRLSVWKRNGAVRLL
jgi:hypothetical protein